MHSPMFYDLVLSSMSGPISSETLARAWPAVAFKLNVPESLLSNEDFEYGSV